MALRAGRLSMFRAEAAPRKFELFPLDLEELQQQLVRSRPNGADIEQIKEELTTST
jgi:hypothetical protein